MEEVILPVGTPFGDFLAFYHDAGEWIYPLIDVCSRVGVFHADARRCLLARPVDSRVPLPDLTALRDLTAGYRCADGGLTGPPDAWHIIYASGGIGDFFRFATMDLPKVIWERNGNGKPRIYDLATIKRKINHHGIKTKDTESSNS